MQKARKGHVSGIKWLLYGLRLQSKNPAVCVTCTSFFPLMPSMQLEVLHPEKIMGNI